MTQFDYAPLTCVMRECSAPLHLEWRLARPLSADDLAPDATVLTPGEDADAAWWKVSCGDGHVILVPGPPVCPCGVDDCDHEDFDAYEEHRTFRASDLSRLRSLLKTSVGRVG